MKAVGNLEEQQQQQHIWTMATILDDNESKKNNRTKGLYHGPAMLLRRGWVGVGLISLYGWI
jgi:hypothetical protein